MPTPEDLTAFLRRLRAVRSFSDEPVAPEVVDDILNVARWSGSSQNLQPWRFILVTERATLRELAAASRTAKHLASASLAVLVAMPADRPVSRAYDDGRVTERIMLAALAHGLGSSIGWFGKEHHADLQRLVGLPDDRAVRTAVSIGHPSAEGLRRKSAPGEARLPLDELVHRERW